VIPSLPSSGFGDGAARPHGSGVKEVIATAGISGAPAMPRGLRHSFGVNAFQSNVPPHLVQRWLGHASLRTTAIYGEVIGPDERAFAERMWAMIERAPGAPQG
jgi:site-specific recombinase XerD